MIKKVKILGAAILMAAWMPVPIAAADACGTQGVGACCATEGATETSVTGGADTVVQLAAPGQGQGRGQQMRGQGLGGQGKGAQMRGQGRGQGQGAQMRGQGRGGAMGPIMNDAHTLVFNNNDIQREIEVLPNGVITRTTTFNPELLAVLQRHPKEMADHLKDGGRVRNWDPLFAELAAVADEVNMEITQLENGLLVRSTSENPEVAKLIVAHAYKVSEFVARGTAAMREGTPLPADYVRADGSTADGSAGTMPACCQKTADTMDAQKDAATVDPHAGH